MHILFLQIEPDRISPRGSPFETVGFDLVFGIVVVYFTFLHPFVQIEMVHHKVSQLLHHFDLPPLALLFVLTPHLPRER